MNILTNGADTFDSERQPRCEHAPEMRVYEAAPMRLPADEPERLWGHFTKGTELAAQIRAERDRGAPILVEILDQRFRPIASQVIEGHATLRAEIQHSGVHYISLKRVMESHRPRRAEVQVLTRSAAHRDPQSVAGRRSGLLEAVRLAGAALLGLALHAAARL